MPTVKVVDLSHHNPEPDWPTMLASGVVGVILKATEGVSYTDDTYATRKAAALEAGLAVSSYHFFHGGCVEEQMSHYLVTAAPVTGERVCIDHESDATLDELAQAVAFIIAARPDLQITIYSGHTIKEQLGADDCDAFLSANTSLWLAEYCDEMPSWPYATWETVSLWQFTDRADVPGCTQPVDGNAWNGSDENLAKWLGPVQPEPAPPVASIITIAIETPPGVECRVTINGQEV